MLSDDKLRGLWTLLERFPATHEKQAPGRKRATHDADGKPFCPISPALAAVQKVRLLTAQRGGEAIGLVASAHRVAPGIDQRLAAAYFAPAGNRAGQLRTTMIEGGACRTGTFMRKR